MDARIIGTGGAGARAGNVAAPADAGRSHRFAAIGFAHPSPATPARVTPHRPFLWLCAALASFAGARAQHAPADEGQVRAAAAKAVRLWLDDYEHNALG